MRPKTLFIFGLILFLSALGLQLISNSLSSELIAPWMHTGTQPMYQVNSTKAALCLLISEELAALGIILIAIAAWHGCNQERR